MSGKDKLASPSHIISVSRSSNGKGLWWHTYADTWCVCTGLDLLSTPSLCQECKHILLQTFINSRIKFQTNENFLTLHTYKSLNSRITSKRSITKNRNSIQNFQIRILPYIISDPVIQEHDTEIIIQHEHYKNKNFHNKLPNRNYIHTELPI